VGPSEAVQLQQPEANAGRAKVLAVASGKGGVGKTNIAVNLSIALAASGSRVILLDADLSLGNVDAVMRLGGHYNISHVLSGLKSMEEIIQFGPGGIEVICGASGLQELAHISEFQQRRLLRELDELARTSDLMVIDTAAGISESVASFCLASDHVLVVTTPEAAAMTDAYGMIKVLVGNGYQGRIGLVVNRADSITEGKKAYKQIAAVAKQFLDMEVYPAGVLLEDSRLRRAVRQREPAVLAYPKAEFSVAINALAGRFHSASCLRQQDQGFVARFIEWFF
jgi:flagellar biosynthesis protein FlhG